MLPLYEIMHPAADCVITSHRIFNFPVELVYRAWTEPKHLANWWGPKGFTNTFHEYNLQPKGFWRFIMHGPDKGNYDNECQFLVIEPTEKLVWNHISNPKFQIVVTFKKVENKTDLTFRMIFTAVELCNKVKAFAGDANEENFDKLEQELKKMQ